MVGSIHLRIVPVDDGQAVGPKQDCGVCKSQKTCWMKGIKDEHIITNLLVCRIKRGIEVDRSAKLLLQMVEPKLKLLAKQAIKGTNIDFEVALADFKSTTIELIQDVYVMGGIAYPLHFLFGMPLGRMYLYALSYAKNWRRFQDLHVLKWDPNTSEDEYTQADLDNSIDANEEIETETTRMAREVIEDGITLTLPEYRILKFCLANATDAKRPLNGLHVYMSKQVGVVRARVTRIYSDACKKVEAETRVSLQ